MPPERVDVVLVYPRLLGVYGDRGNAAALRHRAEARGIATRIIEVEAGQAIPEHGSLYLVEVPDAKPEDHVRDAVLADADDLIGGCDEPAALSGIRWDMLSPKEARERVARNVEARLPRIVSRHRIVTDGRAARQVCPPVWFVSACHGGSLVNLETDVHDLEGLARSFDHDELEHARAFADILDSRDGRAIERGRTAMQPCVREHTLGGLPRDTLRRFLVALSARVRTDLDGDLVTEDIRAALDIFGCAGPGRDDILQEPVLDAIIVVREGLHALGMTPPLDYSSSYSLIDMAIIRVALGMGRAKDSSTGSTYPVPERGQPR